MLELDHLFCLVDADAGWPAALSAAGWELDEGMHHQGQGTRNRRLRWAQQYLELLWLDDRGEASTNPLRLDRRDADARAGANPFGIGLRGIVPADLAQEFWLYEDLGIPLWIHRKSQHDPQSPFLFIHHAEALEMLRPETKVRSQHNPHRNGILTAVHLTSPRPLVLPAVRGLSVTHSVGAHHLELRVTGGGASLSISDRLTLTAVPDASAPSRTNRRT